MQCVANREIYNFRRVPGSGFWKGVVIKKNLTLVFWWKMQNLLFSPSRSDEGFWSSRLVEFVANREIYSFRRVPGSGILEGGEIKISLTLVFW